MELPARTVDHIHRVFGPVVKSDSEASDGEEIRSSTGPRSRFPRPTIPASNCGITRDFSPPNQLRRAAPPSPGRLPGHRYHGSSSDGEDQAAAACRPAWATPVRRAHKVEQMAGASKAPVGRTSLSHLSSSCSEEPDVVAHAARLGSTISLASSFASLESDAPGSRERSRPGVAARRQLAARTLSLQSSANSELGLDGSLGGAVETSLPSWLRWAHRVFSSPSSSCSTGSGGGEATEDDPGPENGWMHQQDDIGCCADEMHEVFLFDAEAVQAKRLLQAARLRKRRGHVALHLGSLGSATHSGSMNGSIPAHGRNRNQPGKPAASSYRRLTTSRLLLQGQGKTHSQALHGQPGEYASLQQPEAHFAAVGWPRCGTGLLNGRQHAAAISPRRSLQAQLDGVSRKSGSCGSLDWLPGGTLSGQEIWRIKAVHGEARGGGSAEPALWETASAPAVFEGRWSEDGMLSDSQPAMQEDMQPQLAREAELPGQNDAQRWQQHLHVMTAAPVAEVTLCYEHSDQACNLSKQLQQARVAATCSECERGAGKAKQQPAGPARVEQHDEQQVFHAGGMQQAVATLPALETQGMATGFSDLQQPTVGVQDSTAQARDTLKLRERGGWKRFFCFLPKSSKSPKLGGSLGQ